MDYEERWLGSFSFVERNQPIWGKQPKGESEKVEFISLGKGKIKGQPSRTPRMGNSARGF